jgi:hypothetical protein
LVAVVGTDGAAERFQTMKVPAATSTTVTKTTQGMRVAWDSGRRGSMGGGCHPAVLGSRWTDLRGAFRQIGMYPAVFRDTLGVP